MGRPTKARHMAARAAKEPRAVRLSDPRMVELTARGNEVRRTAARSSVDVAVESGRILKLGKHEMQRNFGHWLEQLKITTETASNYLAVAELDREAPAVVEKWRFL